MFALREVHRPRIVGRVLAAGVRVGADGIDSAGSWEEVSAWIDSNVSKTPTSVPVPVTSGEPTAAASASTSGNGAAFIILGMLGVGLIVYQLVS